MIADRIRTHRQAVRHASSAALVLIGGIALYNWALAPHVGYLHAVQKLGTVLEHVAEEKERLDGARAARIRLWQDLRREGAELEEGVFTSSGAKAFLRGLLPLVEETGCTVVLADLTDPREVTRIEEPNAPFVLEVWHPSLVTAGQPGQISGLLQRLQDHRPRVWIDSCQCDFWDGGTRPVECSLVLTLYVAENRHPPAGP